VELVRTAEITWEGISARRQEYSSHGDGNFSTFAPATTATYPNSIIYGFDIKTLKTLTSNNIIILTPTNVLVCV